MSSVSQFIAERFQNINGAVNSFESPALSQLKELVEIPSLSIDPDNLEAVFTAAGWLEKKLIDIGMEGVRIIKKDDRTPPLVIAHWCHAGKERPTVLIYNHFDVQPSGKLELWTKTGKDAFNVSIHGDRIYGRGVMDDKGQLFANLLALEALMNVNGGLPVNVVVVYEGQEECGGSAFLSEYLAGPGREELPKVDVVLVSDGEMVDVGVPTISLSTRGAVRREITVTALNDDKHSGSFGGGAMSASVALTSILASFIDIETGKILIDGVYDGVEPDQELVARIAKYALPEEQFLKNIGARAPFGLEGRQLCERLALLPSYTTLGMVSGGLGDELKGVLTATGSAAIEVRIAPGQTIDAVGKLIDAHIEKHTPPQVLVKTEPLGGGAPYMAEYDGPFFAAAETVLGSTFNKEVAYDCVGGSLPILPVFKSLLGVDCLLMNYGQHDSNMHGANENLHLPTFWTGIEATANWLLACADIEVNQTV